MTGAPTTSPAPDVAACLGAHHGTMTSGDLRQLGIGVRGTARLVKAGVLARVGHGAYVDGELLRRADSTEAHALRAAAVARTWPEGTALSHDSAAVLHGLPLLRPPATVRGTRTGGGTSRVSASSTIHRGTTLLPVETRRCVPVVAAAEAVFGVAALHGVEAGVIALDAALHRWQLLNSDRPGDAWPSGRVPRGGGVRPPGLVLPQELEAVLAARAHHPAHAVVSAVRDLADGRCESVGESRTRLVLGRLGYRVRSQVEIHDAVGRQVARVDFALEDAPVVVEFDGLGKYTEHGQTIAGDKARDQVLQRCGYEPVHLLWRHLDKPEAVRSMVEHALRMSRR
ncbi:type IV toxin-antitoxin system AbiEi family antitoxin domain-containing protein [Kytococcus sedentarius]|uniref:type IV toxin-antitoxin system AbiEi family antitoxin domain-containing protein n=1 Tax=Kytococcus sedentarius TaxID=1276 RepID=UPI0035BC1CF3